MNAYFQLINNDQGKHLKIFPPTDGGEMIDAREISDYLNANHIRNDIDKILLAIGRLKDGPAILPMANLPNEPIDEFMDIKTNEGTKMLATARFYPPYMGGRTLKKTDMISMLTSRRISFGIDEDAIGNFAKNREYCKTIEVARGKKAVKGQDAYIEYCFNTNKGESKPKLNEDGSVDFKNLDNFVSCQKGDVLAILHLAVSGKTGYNIQGEPINAPEVRNASFKYGKNVIIEDGVRLVADATGHIEFSEKKIAVSDIYTVKEVGIDTGNIEYEGSVIVEGNVTTGYSIHVGGNVEVRGVVEGSIIKCGGDVSIFRGIKGMSRASIQAGGNVISKFIESATVSAGGYVQSEAILNSTVLARTEINVFGKRGVVSGGHLSATCAVNVKNLGSAMGGDTVIEVGLPPEAKARQAELIEIIADANKSLENIKRVLEMSLKKTSQGLKLPKERMMEIQQLALSGKKKKDELELLNKELAQIEETLDMEIPSMVTVDNTVNAGTRISVSGTLYQVNAAIKHCKFIKIHGEVRMTSL